MLEKSWRLLSRIDYNLLIEVLSKKLADIPLALSKTVEELDEKIYSLVKAINIAMDAAAFMVNVCPRSISGFNEECKKLK